MLWWVQSQLTAVPFLLFWDRSQTWGRAHAGMVLRKSPPCVWLAGVCHAASREELWANYSGDHADHSPSWGQACFSDRVTAWKKAGASWHWKQKCFVYRPSNSSISFPQTDLPAHLCLLPPLGHGGVQAPHPIQFSFSGNKSINKCQLHRHWQA